MSWKYVQRNENGQYKTTEGGGGGGGASALTDLDDVNISSQTNGQVLKYNSTSQKWENANESSGGGSVTDVQVDGVSVVNGQGIAEITTPTPMHNYSTTEQVVGTWIDGKPLYEKTLYVQYSDLTVYGSFKGVQIQGTNEKIRNVISACGISASYGNCFLGCTLYGNLNNRSYYYSLNMYYNILVIEVGGYSWEQVAPDICATIQYTKTTD